MLEVCARSLCVSLTCKIMLTILCRISTLEIQNRRVSWPCTNTARISSFSDRAFARSLEDADLHLILWLALRQIQRQQKETAATASHEKFTQKTQKPGIAVLRYWFMLFNTQIADSERRGNGSCYRAAPNTC